MIAFWRHAPLAPQAAEASAATSTSLPRVEATPDPRPVPWPAALPTVHREGARIVGDATGFGVHDITSDDQVRLLIKDYSDEPHLVAFYQAVLAIRAYERRAAS